MKKKWFAAIAVIAVAGACAGALAACDKDGGKDTAEHVHTYSSVWSGDDNSHWYPATCEHGEKKLASGKHVWVVSAVTPATEDAEGSETLTCAVCGKEKTEVVDKAGHTYSPDWTADATNHWHKATCAHGEEVTGTAAHTFGEWQTVVAATHTVKGVDKRVCTVCNFAETKETETTGNHSYDETHWTADASGHWFAADCGHDLQKNFAAHNFRYVDADVSLTAAEGRYDFNGYHSKQCKGGGSACNYRVWESHNFIKRTVIQEHSCTQDGITDYECDCGFVKRYTTPASHSYYGTWASDETQHWHGLACEHAGDDTLLDKRAHNFTEGIITVEDDGSKILTKYCQTCRYTSVKPVTGATDYDFSVKAVNNRGSVTGNAATIENGEIHIKPDATMNFDFVNIQPADAAVDLKNNYRSIKVYEVLQDGTKVENPGFFVQLDWRTAGGTLGDVVFFQICVADGQSHKVRVESEFAYKEFTVIPDAAEPEVKYSLDGGTSWTDYTAAVTVAAGQEILLTCDYANYTCTGRYRPSRDNIEFIESAPVTGMNKILAFTISDDGTTYCTVTIGGMYDFSESLTFNVAAE